MGERGETLASLRAFRIKAGVAKLLERDRSSFGEIFSKQARDLRTPMLIARVKLVWANLILVHVAAIIAPARGFGDDGIFDVRGPSAKALRRNCRTQRPAI